MEKVGIAIAGLGFGEKVHIEALKNSKLSKPVCLWHPRKERLLKASKENDIESKEWSRILDDRNIKGIVIATPPEPRYKLAKEALEAGKHLLLEKPVALSSTYIQDLQRIALQKELSVAVDFEYRAVPLFRQAQKIIAEGILGNLWLIKFDWLMSSRANKDREWSWYSDKNLGGGVTGALGTHAFDILHWLIGPSSNFNARMSTSIKERFDMLSNNLRTVTSDDTCLANFELTDVRTNNIVPTQLALSSITKNGRGCSIEIYGEKGTLKLLSDNQKDYVHGFQLTISQNNNQSISLSADQEFKFNKIWTDGRIAPVSLIHEWWIESIVNFQPMIPGLIEGYESQVACEKTFQSSDFRMSSN